MTLIWTVLRDSALTRRMKSATGGASDGFQGMLAIRSTSGPPGGPPPALSPFVEVLQPAAAAAATASASRAPAFLSFMSGSRQGDVQPEEGPGRSEGEQLAMRAEHRRAGQEERCE